MLGDSLCCICLESSCDFLTDCCKNKIHKSCIVNWIVYKGVFSCPLCRSETMRIPLNDLLTTPVLEYGLTSREITHNINTLLQGYSIPYSVVIDIPEERSTCHYCLPPYRFMRYRVRYLTCGLTFKHFLYILCIPIFYIVLFCLINNFYISKNIQYLDD